jgi:hypothetical protein
MNERLIPVMNRVAAAARRGWSGASAGATQRKRVILVVGVAALGAWAVIQHPPLHGVPHGDMAVRTNLFSGGADAFREGSVIVLPGLHELRTYTLRDQVYRPPAARSAYQSVEGLSFGIDLAVRYALDPARLVAAAKNLPDDINGQIV